MRWGLVLALAVLWASAPACGAEPGPSRGPVYPTAAEVEPLEPGQRAPAATVSAPDGTPVDLAERWRDSGALLVFYRGGW